MSKDVMYRAANASDAYALAELAILGGDGMYEFLLSDMAPKEMLAGLMARSIQQNDGVYSWRHCYVAVDQGVLAGMIHMLPAELLHEEQLDTLPAERVQVLAPIDAAQDWDSFLVNSISVRPQYRRQGIAHRLLSEAKVQAQTRKFTRLTANIWQDNPAARSLFEKAGFEISRRVEVPQSPGLTHTGGSLLMTLVTAPGGST